jgi:hypothetical protein
MLRIKEQKSPLTEDLMPLDGQVKMTEEPLPSSGNHSWIIAGRKGSGKSTLLIRSIISKKSPWNAGKAFDNVFLCSQSAHRDDKFSDLVEELEQAGHFHTTFNQQILDDIIEEIKEFNDQYKEDMMEWDLHQKQDGKGYYTRVVGKTREGKDIIRKIYKKRLMPRHLLILDDVLNLLPKSTQNSRINDLYTNHRHSKLSIITTTQVYNKLNTVIRRNADMLSLFRTENAGEYDAMEGDWEVEKGTFRTLYDYATKAPNSFLHLQLCGPRPIFFSRFNRIRLLDGSESE